MGKGGEDEGEEKKSGEGEERKEDGGRGSLMLGTGFLASLAREEKAGIEWRLFRTAVLEPSSGSLGSLGLPWQQGAVL